MAESKKYVTGIGFVQFDPQERDANGKQVTDVVIKTPGGDGKFLRITLWPELLVEKSLGRKVQKGDLLAVDGGFSSSVYQDKEGKQRTSLQISAFMLNINGTPIERADREVVTDSSGGGSEDSVF
jgi:single-stranded DNA-binding protein